MDEQDRRVHGIAEGLDAQVDYLLQAAKLLERDRGCIHCVVSTSDEPEAVWVCEVWADQAAHDASLDPRMSGHSSRRHDR